MFTFKMIFPPSAMILLSEVMINYSSIPSVKFFLPLEEGQKRSNFDATTTAHRIRRKWPFCDVLGPRYYVGEGGCWKSSSRSTSLYLCGPVAESFFFFFFFF